MIPSPKEYNDVLTFMMAHGYIDMNEYIRLLQFTPTEPPSPPTIQPLKPHIAKLLEQRRKNRR